MIYITILILFTHFIGDFICQTDDMAKGKSKSLYWLGKHVATYTLILYVFAFSFLFYHYDTLILFWVIINGFLHFVVDFFTSKLNAKLWADKKIHWFFVGVGFDQFLHFTCLLLTFNWLIK